MSVILVKIVLLVFWQFDTFVRQNMAVKIVLHFCQTKYSCQNYLTFLSDKIWLSKLSLTFLSKLSDTCLDTFDTFVRQNMTVKIVWHFCQTKYGCQNCLSFLSKLSDTCFDTFDTFVRQNIAVKIVWHFFQTNYGCQNCLTLLWDKISLSKLCDTFVR